MTDSTAAKKSAKIHPITEEIRQVIEKVIAAHDDLTDRCIQLSYLRDEIELHLKPALRELMPSLQERINPSEKGQRKFKVKGKGALFSVEIPADAYIYSHNKEWTEAANRKMKIETAMREALTMGKDTGHPPAKEPLFTPFKVKIYPQGNTKGVRKDETGIHFG